MKKGSFITAISILLVPMMAMAQKQYYLPTGSADMSENDQPMIEVYLPRQDVANGCAVVLCPGGAPITNGRLNMGTWQGIYFCEYRNYGGARDLVVTIMGE